MNKYKRKEILIFFLSQSGISVHKIFSIYNVNNHKVKIRPSQTNGFDFLTCINPFIIYVFYNIYSFINHFTFPITPHISPRENLTLVIFKKAHGPHLDLVRGRVTAEIVPWGYIRSNRVTFQLHLILISHSKIDVDNLSVYKKRENML